MMRPLAVVTVCGLLVSAVAAPDADAQFGGIRNKIKDKIKEKVSAPPVPTPSKPDAPETPETPEPADADAAEAPAQSGTQSDAAPADRSAAKLEPGQGAWSNYDFVAGDTILFAEDFTSDRVGNFPRRLELERGNFEVVEWSGRRWLRANGTGEFIVTLPKALPERWTMEFEMTLPSAGVWIYPGTESDQAGGSIQQIHLSDDAAEAIVPGRSSTSLSPMSVLGEGILAENRILTHPLHVRVQADGAYMKVYLEEQRVINVPNMGRWQGNLLHFDFGNNTNGGELFPPLMTALTVNAGGAEFYDTLMAAGRLAVPGIYFDTGSSRIRPESSGTLAEITSVMSAHPELKLLIEGHTDNVGDAGANKTLSAARAAAVVTYLSGKGVAPSRLSSAGLGDTKPAAPNDSAENRQRNRRVELVVQK